MSVRKLYGFYPERFFICIYYLFNSSHELRKAIAIKCLDNQSSILAENIICFFLYKYIIMVDDDQHRLLS